MFINYIKIAIRNIKSNLGVSFINVTGMATGLACAILILLWVKNELSYDTFHENSDHIYRLETTKFDEDGTSGGYAPHHPIPCGPALESDIPEIKYAIRFSEEVTFVKNDNMVDEESILLADSLFFTAFSFDFKYGTNRHVLSDPFSIVLSEQSAIKYFGETNPVGKIIEVLIGEKYIALQVTGVLKPLPSNSSVSFDFVAPYLLLRNYQWFQERLDSWHSWNSPTYVVLKENADAQLVENKMVSFWETYLGEWFNEIRANGSWKYEFNPIKTRLQPLENVRHTRLKFYGIASFSDPKQVFILSGIALGILFIACINFMNLSISQASNRSTEIAVRKIVGATRSQLAHQFWIEAVIISFISMVIALFVVELALPGFNDIVQSHLKFNISQNWLTLFAIFGITLATGIIAGSYPSLLMSAFKPANIFNKKFRFGSSNLFTRILVIFQFCLAIIFIAYTVIIFLQLKYINTFDVGFNKDRIVVVRGDYQSVDATRIMDIFQKEFSHDPDIEQISGINYSFSRGYDRIGFRGKDGNTYRAWAYRVSPNFLDFMEIPVVSGRNFNTTHQSHFSNAVIVNEKLIEAFEIKNPIQSRIHGLNTRGLKDPQIIGVAKDFHFASLNNIVEPMIMYVNPEEDINYVLARLKANKIQAGISKLEKKWSEINPDLPFQYSFLDEDMEQQYLNYAMQEKVVNYASKLSILVIIIGLFGLSTYTLERRKKEIGIRKVLGASVGSVLELMIKEYMLLVIVANLVALPLAYYFAREWLQNFAYRIDLTVLPFVLSGLFALMLTFLTVFYQTIKAALANPVDSLRYE
ncbi:FtsX-like permease family protein [candidate division KSB1 bacterium]|nr:FtsX-like permease family protein [candidate division KSB1 bacterium]